MGVIGRIGFVSALLVYVFGANCAAQAAPVEVYGELPSIIGLQLSPSGQRVAYVTPLGRTLGVAVKDLNSAAKPITLSLGDADLQNLQWAGNDYLVVTALITSDASPVAISAKRKFMIAFVLDIARQRTIELAPPSRSNTSGPEALNALNAPPYVRLVNGHEVVFFDAIAFANGEGVDALYSYDPRTNAFQTVVGPKVGQDGFVIDARGQVVAISSLIGRRWTLKLNPMTTASASLSLETSIGGPSVLGLGRRPDTVWVSFPDAVGEREWREISLKDGSFSSDLTEFQKLGGPILDRETQLVIGGYRNQEPEMFYDPELEKFWSAVVRAFGDEKVNFVSMSQDKSKFIVRAFGANNGLSYLLINRATGRADPIADIYRGLAPVDIAAMKSVSYTARDGLSIPAYLTLPNGRPAKSLPMVVLPHENADGSDAVGFSWLAQAFASRGYAVFMPQFRGSSGRGDDFRAAGFGQWGGKMQTDLSDGVQALAAQGVIDPKRVCIVGGAYGGFAALNGALREPSVYRCAVSIDGITDLKSYLHSIRDRSLQQNSPAVRYWERMLAAKSGGDPINSEISPALNAGRASVPILLIQATEDSAVPPGQTQAMADALRKANKPYDLVKLIGEDHDLSHDGTRKQALQAVVRFLEANNPPDLPIKIDSAALVHW